MAKYQLLLCPLIMMVVVLGVIRRINLHHMCHADPMSCSASAVQAPTAHGAPLAPSQQPSVQAAAAPVWPAPSTPLPS